MIVCDHDTTQLFDPVMDNRPVFVFYDAGLAKSERTACSAIDNQR